MRNLISVSVIFHFTWNLFVVILNIELNQMVTIPFDFYCISKKKKTKTLKHKNIHRQRIGKKKETSNK